MKPEKQTVAHAAVCFSKSEKKVKKRFVGNKSEIHFVFLAKCAIMKSDEFLGGDKMENCIFCNIVSGKLPGHVLYENQNVLAFLDLSQTTKGHTLIVPKTHRGDVFEMRAQEMEEVFSIVPQLAQALKQTFGCVGLNLVNNNGKVAGQTVFHYHVHLIPRYEAGDFGIDFSNNMADYSSDDLGALRASILKNLEASS